MGFVILKFIKDLFWILIWFSPLAMLWIVGGAIIYPVIRRLAWKRLPKAANELGLIYQQSRYRSEFGSLTGKIKGHEISVKLDDSKITISRSEKQLELWTKRSHERPTKEMPDFKTGDLRFSSIFKTRRASPSLAARFDHNPVLLNSFVRFYSRWMWSLESLYMDGGEIFCKFNYGYPFFPYLPASALERILTDLVDLAEHMDNTL